MSRRKLLIRDKFHNASWAGVNQVGAHSSSGFIMPSNLTFNDFLAQISPKKVSMADIITTKTGKTRRFTADGKVAAPLRNNIISCPISNKTFSSWKQALNKKDKR